MWFLTSALVFGLADGVLDFTNIEGRRDVEDDMDGLVLVDGSLGFWNIVAGGGGFLLYN